MGGSHGKRTNLSEVTSNFCTLESILMEGLRKSGTLMLKSIGDFSSSAAGIVTTTV